MKETIEDLMKERNSLLARIERDKTTESELLDEREGLKAKLEQAEDRVDSEWLEAIGTAHVRMFGKHWETRDGETREEGLSANIGALFQLIEDQKARAETAEACCAEMRGVLELTVNLIRYEGHTGQHANCESCRRHAMGEHALSTDCGTSLLEEIKGLKQDKIDLLHFRDLAKLRGENAEFERDSLRTRAELAEAAFWEAREVCRLMYEWEDDERSGSIDKKAKHVFSLDCGKHLLARVKRLEEALSDLLDEQNGPPFCRREKQWQHAYDAGRKLLSEKEAK